MLQNVVRHKLLIIGAGFVVVWLNSCAVNPVTGNRDLVFVTEDQEIEGMGERYHPHLVRHYGGEYDDPKLKAYVVSVGERLARVSHRDDLVYHFTILDTPLINAFATPGYVYITRGMLAYLGSEAELAAVLGHELGHITARHSVRQHTKGTLAAILANVIASSGNNTGWVDLSQFVSTAVIRGYGRKYELEADQLGAEYLARSGYEPSKILDVLRVLKDQESFEKQLAKEQGREPNVYHGIFATHPDNDLRLQEAVNAASELQKSTLDPEVNRAVYLEQIDGMTFGASEKQGVVRNSRFYHLDLGITFALPEAWNTKNLPDHLAAYNKGNTLMIVLVVEDRNRRHTPQDFLTRRYRKSIVEGSLKPLDAEMVGWTALLKNSNTPYGRQPLSRIAVLFSNKRVYRFLAATKDDGEFDQADSVFMETIQSLRPLKDAEHELAKPKKIKLVRIKEGDSFADLVKDSSLSDHAEETLRLINGRYPDGNPEPGELVKNVN